MSHIKVTVTKDEDLVLTFDFENKTIFVNTNHWTVTTKRTYSKIISEPVKEEANTPPIEPQKPVVEKQKKEEWENNKKIVQGIADKKDNDGGNGKPTSTTKTVVEPNKKVKPTAEELKIKQILEVFESLRETSFNDSVELKAFKRKLIANKVLESREFNEHLNKLLSKDLIEETEDRGYYKLK